MRTTLLLLALLGLGLGRLLSQEGSPPEKPAWVQHATTHLGLNFNRSYDQRLAPRSFYGLGLELGLGDRWVRPQTWHEYEIMVNPYAAAPLHAENFLSGGLLELSYRYLRRINPEASPWRLHLGGQVGTWGNLRIHGGLGNSLVHAEWVAYLGPLFQVAREAELPLLKGPSTLSARAHLPLLSYVGRLPAYSLPGFEAPAHYFRPFGGFTRLKTEISITRPKGQNNPNLTQLSYVWDFYALNEGFENSDYVDRLRWGMHSLRLTILLRKGDLEQ